MTPSPSGGNSIIQGLYEVWNEYHNAGTQVHLVLYSNALPDSNDPFISCRDGKDGTVAMRLSQARNAILRRQRSQLATHLSASEDSLIEFLNHLSIRIGRLYDELREDAKIEMYAAGLRFDDTAVTEGEALVRTWVTNGVRKLTTEELLTNLAFLQRENGLPKASLFVQAIDRDLSTETATIVFDWVDYFQGDEPRTRRVLRDTTLWNTTLRPALRQAAVNLRSQNATRVLVRGFMRLPTWFTVGTALSKTAGFAEVVSFQGASPWSSVGDLADFPVVVNDTHVLGSGTDLAITVAASMDPSADVVPFVRANLHAVKCHFAILPVGGIGNTIFTSDKQVRQWAYCVRDAVRDLAREYRPSQLHLFLAVPHGAAMILGHLWDRLPTTQLYEDGGASDYYSPSFLIPN